MAQKSCTGRGSVSGQPIACGCQKIVSAGSLANVREHDSRDWGKGSLDTALRLCIAVLRSF